MRFDGRVRAVRVQVSPLDDAAGEPLPLGQVAALADHAGLRRGLQEMVEDRLFVGDRRLGIEVGLDLFECSRGHVAPLVKHGYQIAILHHAHAGHSLGRGGVHAQAFGAVHRRPQQPGMQQPCRQLVTRVYGLSGHFVPRVFAARRLPDHLKLRDWLDRDIGEVFLDALAFHQACVGH